ncbi:Molybdopterin-guanine dinucleotide biosynthesis protein A [Geoglobus ahangari]|uniref:Probable molybdenum cofactor guanylyltransferase n=1 Tax=Geoglobus ahangari TaxID=113653 RepID=A0A0F7IEZ3_9EURY|nr:molybdenum cofactor guanylyltransferase [Geoglobus ahangari]AKG92183.1 Molybdopterin-guanine dinucleotide biosynthesis protein A [Geoglobus ahangari]
MNLAILVGGRGRRLGGIEKSQLRLCGRKVIDILTEEFSSWNVVVVCRDQEQKGLFEGVECVVDRVENFGPLAGIYSALEFFGDRVAVVATDMPFLREEVVGELFRSSEKINASVLMPYWRDGRFEPLASVYSPELMPEIEKSFERNERKILAPVFRAERVFLYDVECLRKIDKNLISFFNINTAEDLKRAEELCSLMLSEGE